MYLAEDVSFSVGSHFFLLTLREGRVTLYFNNVNGVEGFTATAVTMATYNDGLVHNVWAEYSGTELRFVVDQEDNTITEYDSGGWGSCS